MSDQAESDNLRRSKRKKFRLDVVAAAHGNNQKKSRRSGGGGDDYDDVDMDDFDEDDEMMQQLNVTTDDSMTEYVDDDDDALSKRRTRRSTAVFQNYQQDTIGSWVENSGPYACAKCPSRYESKSSLANHNKMHTGEIRKFACELCDFSASTLKSLTHHNNVHKQFGVLSPQISPAVKVSTASTSPGAASVVNGTSNGAAANGASAMNTSLESTSSTSAPQLEVEVAEVTAPEPGELEEVALEDGGPPFLDRQDEDDDGPPVLEREVSESPEPELPVRKSNRSAKPTQKKLEQKSRGPRGPYAKKIPKLELMETSGGSLPTSSASSVTPPPLRAESSPEPEPSTSTVTKKKSHKKKTPAAAPPPQKKKQQTMKKRKRCPRCPYTCTSTARLNRHFGGHRLREGFMCPVEKCHFMCRKPGFLPKHFILHKDATLPWPPKYCKVVGKRGAGERVKEVKSHQNVKKTEEVVEEKKKIKKQEGTGKKRKLNVEEEKKQLEEKKKAQEEKRVHMMRQAQIKTHTKVQQDNVTYKKCNIAECDFQTVSMTQLIVHKTKVHGAKSAFAASHKFMCTTCGHRAKTYASLRSHKLTNHLAAGHRFHRTFYLKEILGERFFIKYFADGKMPEESGEKVKKEEELPAPEPEVVKEVTPEVEAPPTTSEVRMEEDEEDDGSGDESFDSISASTDVPPETLAAMNKKEVFFCCNMCPYKAPTMNRCQRHYAKHFTNDPFKCAHCSWSSRSREVIHSHQKLHEPPEEVAPPPPPVVEEPKVEEPVEPKVEETSEDSKEEKEEKDSKKSPPKVVVFSEDLIASPIFAPLQKWCTAEKAKRPELNDQFSRKMIDGVKGFQCLDCPYTSKYRGDMRSHKKRHDIQQMYRCVQCTYTTNRPVSLKDHLKQHVALNKVNLENAASKKVVVNQGIPIGHRKGAGKFRIYTCDQCPFTTLTVGCLWRHHRNHRSPARSNICSNCSYSSLEQRKMEEHTLIHLALGGVGEPMPFVKRVDNKGRPVSSLTDLNSEKMSERKSNKRGKATVKEEEEEEVEQQTTSQRVLRTPKAPKPVKEPKEKTPKKKEEKPPKPDGRKTRKQSLEPSPDPDYSIPGPSSQPTRQLSERATRNRINYSLLSKNGSGKPTPSSSSANLEKLGAVQEEEEPEEPLEVTHWRIRSFLNEEFASTKDPEQCPECPYKTDDPEVMSMHTSFHSQKTHPRPYSCSDCTFNTYTPTALLQHLKLHSEGVCFDPSVNKRQAKHQRKGDYIPPGAKGFYCKNCSFKTINHRSFVEHAAYHRHQLINRINITLKRQPPKEEYQRPKLKTQFVAKNAKYCKKCTFKCVSQNAYIEHLDRHGWNQLYKCYMCDYSDNNKSVVDFHQLTHHIVRDQTLHGINQASKFRIDNGQIQTPETSKHAKPTPEEFVQKSRTLLKCPSCDYYCHVAEDLGFHMSVDHRSDDPKKKSTKDNQETATTTSDTISYLKMGLIPPKATVTIV